MLGQRATSAASSVDNRIFVYEVTGLTPNEAISGQRPPVRSSQNQTFQVPFHRMNKEMQRITRLGGEIVSISPLNDHTATSQSKNSTEESSAKSAAASAE